MPQATLGALLASAAAIVWGGGDYSGGMGVKAAGGGICAALRIVLLGHGASLIVLLAIAVATGEPFPHGTAMCWGLAGGVAGGAALAAFYIALSRGSMGASAAISGLLAAAVPTLVSSLMEGHPTAMKLGGFAVAAVAIWLIAAADTTNAAATSRGTMALAIAGGFGFGLFFVALKLASPLGTIVPLALARLGSLLVCGLMLAGMTVHGGASEDPRGWRLGRAAVAWAMGVALLDTGGNLLFLLATRHGRLDIAAVLSSLYPASTILLAAWLLHERPTRQQWVGMAAALVAVVMVTL